MAELSPDEKAAIQLWNQFLTSLLETQKAWNSLVEFKQNVRINNDSLPPQAGKFFGLATTRSTFSIAVERLLTYARKYDSIEGMIVKLEPEVKEKEKSYGRRSR